MAGCTNDMTITVEYDEPDDSDVSDEPDESRDIIGLPAAARDDLGLTVSAHVSETITLDPEDEDSEEISRHVVGYHREGSALVQSLIGPLGSGRPAPATLLRVSDAHIETVQFTVGGDDGAIDARDVNILVPDSGRRGGQLFPEECLLVVPMFALTEPGGGLTSGGWWHTDVDPHEGLDLTPENHRVIPVGDFFPHNGWVDPELPDNRPPVDRWAPGIDPQLVEHVFLTTGAPGIDAEWGIPATDMPGRPLEEGETIDAREFLLVAPAAEFTSEWDRWGEQALFDAGRPAPLGGTTYGLGVNLIPTVQAFEIPPVGEYDTIESWLRNEQSLELVMTYTFDVFPQNWIERPTSVGVRREATYDIGGERGRTDVETFIGAAEMNRGIEFVGLHVTTIPPRGADNEVTAVIVGGQRTPIARFPESIHAPADPTVDGERLAPSGWHDFDLPEEWRAAKDTVGEVLNYPAGWSDWSRNPWIDWIEGGAELTVAAVDRLDYL